MKLRVFLLTLAAVVVSQCVLAVPARPGFSVYRTADGTEVSLEMVGDEFGHWLEDIDGNAYHLTDDGTVVKSAQTVAQLSKARKSSPRYQASRPHRAVGTVNLAPRGIVILVNFKDVSMKSTNNQSAFNELMNGANYTYRGTYNSVREYFKAQSNGQYIPDFDVYGPVTISNNYAYYGANIDNEQGEDRYAANVVVEAVKAVDAQYDVDFTQYNNDGDSYIDFVYVIYAGKGEADGGAASTIWPHNWDLESAYYFGNCTYTKANRKVDGLYINNYAMSGEIDGQSGYRASIGTIAHEFGHVLGLPDFYDTDYSSNRSNKLTPGKYDIMDQGSYNGMDSGGYSDVGTCPPNYSPWERFFLGWETPVNLGTTPANLIFYPLGSSNYTCYQVNSSGNYQSCTSTGLQYYIENRQQTGWDSYLPGHGMLVWKLNYNASYWEDNAPNITSNGNPHYTLVSAYGTQINYAYNTYPGSQSVTEWKSISARPVTSISESGGIVTAKYMGGSTTITKYEQELSYFTAVNYETAGLAGDYEVYLYDPNGSLFAIADITTGNDYSLAGTFSVGTEAGAQYNSTIYIDGERQSVTSGNITFKYLGKSGETDIYQVTATDWYIPSLDIYYDMYGTVYGNAVWKTPFVNCGYTTDGCDDAIISVTDEFDNRCGDNLTWELSSDLKTLTISGYGDMWDFTVTDMTDNTIPWVSAYATIEKVILPDGITSIGEFAFFNHYNLKTVSFPSSLTRIGAYSFAGVAVTAFTLPAALTYIGKYAFAYTSITSVTIPKNVTYLEEDIFNTCSSLKQVNYSAVNCQIASTYTTQNPFVGVRSQLTTFAFGNEVEVIPAGLCYGMSALRSITLPASLTTLNGNAFYGCTSLTSIAIPKNMNYIGKDVFAGCSKLKTVVWNAKTCQLAGTNTANTPFRSICEQITSFTIGDDVEELPTGCCFGMTQLTSVTIPAQLSYLGVYCFHTCTSLQTVRFNRFTPPSVHSSAFSNIPSTAVAQVPCGAKLAYETTTLPFASYTTFGDAFPYTVTLGVREEETGSVEWLFTPDCDENNAVVEATPAEGYAFSQWSDGSEENPHTIIVTEDMTLTAEFERNQYTITFQDEDGTVLESNLWYYGETPIYNGADPTKDADDEYTYTFAGWDNGENVYSLGTNLPDVTGDATYTAVYESEQNQYTVTFVDEDGTVLESNLWYYGETPIYRGDEPTKDADDEYTYTFLGWDKDIVTVTEDATYTAVYSSEQNQYTITFADEDGTVLQSDLWYYGETPAYNGNEPTKQADAEYTYIFAGWDKDIATVTEDATYTAVYSSERNQYTVTFQDEDGTVLQSDLWYYGETPAYNGNDPTKEPDDEYTYTFLGWDKDIASVTEDATYTAVYSSERNQYTVTFQDEDGTVLQSDLWYYGETPAYNGNDPTKEPDAEYTYIFAGWDKDIVTVTEDATYTAVYESEQNQYTVTFQDEDGTVLESNLWYYGETPIYRGAEPTKDADDEYTYIFAGWDKDIVTVTEDATYTAVYSSEQNQYTITFADEDGTVLQSDLWYYGETPAYNGNEPTKQADAEYTYIFAGWDKDIATVTEDATYTAVYSSERNQYTVTFQDEDGTVLQSDLWYYGETPAYNGNDPTKQADAEYTYIFAGWDKDIATVTEDATYTAVYESEQNQYTVTFQDEDGTVLESNLWYYGETPIYNGTNYNGENPTKDADDEYTYTFAGWANAESVYPLGTNLPDVTGEATYTATYAATKNLSMNIVLEENKDADYYTQFAEDYNGVTVQTATLNRQFGQNKWSTICLPFDVKKGVMMSLGLYGRVFEYRYTEQLGEGTVQLYFSVAQSIEAGKGYIVSANAKLAAKTSFVFTNVTINTDADLLSGYDITALEGYNDGTGRSNIYLVGSLRTGLLKATNNGVTYLGLSNNKLYSPNQTTGTSIRAYRGFFRSLVPLNIQRVRIVAEGLPVTELQVSEQVQESLSEPQVRKYTENGILYIERDGIIYNAQGQRVN